jgi:hypothetical protein
MYLYFEFCMNIQKKDTTRHQHHMQLLLCCFLSSDMRIQKDQNQVYICIKQDLKRSVPITCIQDIVKEIFDFEL